MSDAPSTPLARILRLAEHRAPRLFAKGLAQASRDASMVERRLLLGRAPSPLVRRGPRRELPVLEVVREARPQAAPAPTESAITLTVVDGEARTVCTPAEDAYVLQAALEAGANMPFSCALGGCGSCKVRLVSGTYEMDDPNCLSDEERAAGFVLTCVGRAKSPCTLEILR